MKRVQERFKWNPREYQPALRRSENAVFTRNPDLNLHSDSIEFRES